MRKLTSFCTLFIILAAQTAAAGQLYQWYGKDGTPTYSPEAPPKGVSFTIVGDDLEPLKDQPALAASKEESAPAVATKTKTQPTPAAVPKWEPVRYANDPALGKPFTPKLKSKTVVESSIGAPLSYESEECIELKQKKLIVESQFARATSDAEMDKAILALGKHQSAYNKLCRN